MGEGFAFTYTIKKHHVKFPAIYLYEKSIDMKKTLDIEGLALILILAFSSYGSVNGQSLTSSNQYITGDPSILLQGHVTINNISTSAKSVLVERRVNNLAPGHVSYFCWGNCYTPSVSLSTDTVLIGAGSDTDVFKGDLETNNNLGVSLVTYCFFDVNNQSDSVCVDFVYDFTLGTEVLGDGKIVHQVYPNPATDEITLSYTIPANTNKAQLVVLDILGREVAKLNITEPKGEIKMSVKDLEPGQYVYLINTDGKNLSSWFIHSKVR
jgi:hypothetical protein